MTQFLDHYALDALIGHGASSWVVSGHLHSSPHDDVAIKLVPKKPMVIGDQPATPERLARRQRRVLMEYFLLRKQLVERHPSLVQVEAVGQTTNFVFFVQRRYLHGSLSRLLASHSNSSLRKHCLSEREACYVVCKVLSALEFLHSLDVVYRDLKPENILVDSSFDVALSDFDLSHCTAAKEAFLSVQRPPPPPPPPTVSVTSSMRTLANHDAEEVVGGLPQRRTSFVGTIDYLSPDVLQDEPVTAAIDLWGVGMLTYELLCGIPMFHGLAERDTLYKLQEYIRKKDDAKPVFPVHPPISTEAKEFISLLLVPRRSQRMTLEGASKHRWMTSFGGFQAVLRQQPSPLWDTFGPHHQQQGTLKASSRPPSTRRTLSTSSATSNNSAHSTATVVAPQAALESKLLQLRTSLSAEQILTLPTSSMEDPLYRHVTAASVARPALIPMERLDQMLADEEEGISGEGACGEGCLTSAAEPPKESYWTRLIESLSM